MTRSAGTVRIEDLDQLVPGPASASGGTLAANNNLDLIRHDSRLYLAWRTAPSHFASSAARLKIASTDDPSRDTDWRHETTISLGTDVREPRFVAGGRGLHLFFVELGSNPRRFEPRRVRRVDLDASTWSEPAVAVDEPIVAWRIRSIDGTFVMSSYRGAERMYGPRPIDPVTELRTSDDLVSWSPGRRAHDGGIEMELVRLPDERILALTRNEGPSRFGSDVIVTPAGAALGEIAGTEPVPCRRKLDSPNLFLWGGEPWLVARRSLANDGHYDVAPRWLPGAVGIRVNQGLWSASRKRSALWRIDPDTAGVEWVADLPSRGDTSFAAVVVEDESTLLVADYTTPASLPDTAWIRSQLRPTVIQLLHIHR